MDPSPDTLLAEARRMARECALVAVFEGLVPPGWPEILDVQIQAHGTSAAGLAYRPFVRLNVRALPVWQAPEDTPFADELKALRFDEGDWRGPLADALSQLVALAVSRTHEGGVARCDWRPGARWRETWTMLRRAYVLGGQYRARAGLSAATLTVRADAAGSAAARACLRALEAQDRWQAACERERADWFFFSRNVLTPAWFAYVLVHEIVWPVVRSAEVRPEVPTLEGVLDWLKRQYEWAGVEVDPLSGWFAVVSEDHGGDSRWLGVRALCCAAIDHHLRDGVDDFGLQDEAEVARAEEEGLRLALGGAVEPETAARLSILPEAYLRQHPRALRPVTSHPSWLPPAEPRALPGEGRAYQCSADLCSALCQLESLRELDLAPNRDGRALQAVLAEHALASC
jgi:hypothetical protein